MEKFNKENEKKERQLENLTNLVENYKGAGRYVQNNFDNISKEDLKNIQEKQKNRKRQIENFEEE